MGARHVCFLSNIISSANAKPIGIGFGIEIRKPESAVISIPTPMMQFEPLWAAQLKKPPALPEDICMDSLV
ncbi:MAG: hypothetical protein JXR49_14590 [Acidobacteria bacterium]|nr:hypothetical protein [Acidobacteriota bacterium]